MNAVVLGIGRMGAAISWAMSQLGFNVCGVDSNPNAANNMPEGKNFDFLVSDNTKEFFDKVFSEKKPDIVISSLPYHQTEQVAYWCINKGVRYCDLGGRVDVSLNINNYAKNHATVPVFTDLGLAPGWVNILAEEGYRNLYGQGNKMSVEMMVGGLPSYLESNKNPLRYGITWSVDGLINEYKDDCFILKDGEIQMVKGMDGLEDVETDSLGKLEAFYTSGGASHSILSMKEKGVLNCSYKTLRYRGHRDIVKFLIRDCNLGREALNKIFLEGCGFANKDEVIIVAKVTKDNRVWREEKLINADNRFSAMQKATAFPISSVASLMAEGLFDNKKSQCTSHWEYFDKNLAYSDIPFDKFKNNLSKLGI